MYYKIGITDDIDERLRIYRTSMPDLKILFLVYIEEYEYIEKSLKLRYRDNLIEPNHEYIIGINLEEIIRDFYKIAKFMKLEHTVEEDLESYNNPYEEDLEESDEIESDEVVEEVEYEVESDVEEESEKPEEESDDEEIIEKN